MTCYACGVPGGPMFLRQFPDRRNADWICQRCAEDVDAGADPRVPPDRQPTALTSQPRATELALPSDPGPVPRWSVDPGQLAEVDGNQLATAFVEMARHPLPPAPDSTERQREAIGRAIAEYLTSAQSGEHADVAAARIVAAVGAVEAWRIADVLGKWACAIAARAERAEKGGMGR